MMSVMREAATALRVLLVMTVLTGLVYPLAVTGAAVVLFPFQAHGSLVRHAGEVVGSALVGQAFTSPRYFLGRPSASDYEGGGAGPSNLGPTSADLVSQVRERARDLRARFTLSADERVPGDLVTSSGSGLDPHISVEAALIQAPSVARARDLPEETVLEMVKRRTEGRQFGFFGQPRVNVLLLNIDLDSLGVGP